MRQKLIAILTVFFFLLSAGPVWADVNLNINGTSYAPLTAPQLDNGTTMVPLYVAGRVLGAQTNLTDNAITVKKGSNTLILRLNDTNASLNGKQLVMPKAPALVNGEAMVPLRFTCEAFGAKVTWDQDNQTAGIQYSEQRRGMSMEEIMLKSSEAILKYNTYKTKVAINMDMEMANAAKPEETVNAITNMDMDLAMQQKPLLVYGKTTIESPALPEAHNVPMMAATEMFISEEGIFMTMPGQEGWFKMNLPGMDMKTLIEQSNSNDPVASLRMMQESGAIMSFADDQEKDGRSYWVINVTLGADSFSKLFQNVMGQMPTMPEMGNGQDPNQDMNQMMQTIFKNMKADMVYRVWVDQASLLPTFMDLNAAIDLNIPATTVGDETTQPMAMSITEKAFYEIYDLGKPFAVPDVSQAKDLNEFMEQQMAAAQL